MPAALCLIAALMWGLWWLPLRAFEDLGLPGVWAGVAMNAGAALVAITWVAVRRTGWPKGRAVLGAVLIGLAVACYSTALTMTEVVRAVLLFYLAPAWSKLIEMIWLGTPARPRAFAPLALGLPGAWMAVGGGGLAGAFGPGDWLALMSGLAWAAGAALVFAGPRSSWPGLAALSAGAATLAGLPFALTGGPPSAAFMAGALAGAAYVLPILGLTLWAAMRLPPAIMSFVLTAEIVSGVVSAAIWADEPFGPMQAAGAVLIAGAALAEIGAQRRS